MYILLLYNINNDVLKILYEEHCKAFITIKMYKSDVVLKDLVKRELN